MTIGFLVALGVVAVLSGGLAGALLYARLGGRELTLALAGLLILTGVTGLARTPVYLWRAGSELRALWLPIALATAGVLGGTLLGERMLLGMTPERFRRVVSVAILALGAAARSRRIAPGS